MINNHDKYGMLYVKHYENDNNVFCRCECGLNIIIAADQLNDSSSCGCINRKLLLSLVGAVSALVLMLQ